MSSEENRRLVRLFADGYTQRDNALIKEALAPDMAKDWIEKWIPQNSTYWADDRLEITDVMAEGDRVWARVASGGGHTGEWEGVAPTGKRWTNAGVLFVRIADGRIAEWQGLFDNLNLLKQLGVTLTPPARGDS